MSEELLPLLSFDLDGVLARPPFGRNLTINRNLHLEPAPSGGLARAGSARPWDSLLAATYYRLRYSLRPALPLAAEVVAAATREHRVIVLTARNARGRRSTESWLERQGIASHLHDLVMNDSGLAPPQFKRAVVEALGVVRHVEDDAATAALLARHGVAVDLIDWPRNRGLSYPAGVTRRLGLQELIDSLAGS